MPNSYPMTACRHFNGYKPCGRSEICDNLCPHLSVPTTRLLVVHLEALGAVVRSTALLPAIRRKFPGCHITWVTQRPANEVLINNPYIDRVLTTSPDDLLCLAALDFDVGFCLDKSLKSAGVLRQTRVDVLYGFQVQSQTGAILPASPPASELWSLGLSNHQKLHVNRKSETQLMHEALELGPWLRDRYVLALTEAELREVQRRRAQWANPSHTVIGLNTGCSPGMPYKKLAVGFQRQLVSRLLENSRNRVVLLGGQEDTVRNERIGHGLKVIQSSTNRGLRDGILSVAACDIVISGDSLGMHLAIGLEKWTVAWFGPTCAHEIDLYGRGVQVLTEASCSPCWKRQCERTTMCYDLVDLDRLLAGVQAGQRHLESEPLNCQLAIEAKI